MAKTTRQTAIFGVEDWKRIYQTYREADFQSYDFETLRKSFIDYIRLYYPENFNDYVESSEFIALLDVMAFMGQSLSFRNDLNTRENFLDTAERRDSVVKLANLVSYTPKRNEEANGYLKVFSVSTSENLVDYNGINLSDVTVNWNDIANPNWQEQFTVIINAALVDSQRVGKPGASKDILGIQTQEYTINLVPGYLPVVPFTSIVDNNSMTFEAVSATTQNRDYVYEPAPRPSGEFNMLYRNDHLGYASANTGYFFFFKQGVLQNFDFSLSERVSNRVVNVNIEGINNTDIWLYQLDENGFIQNQWEETENLFTAAVEQTAANARKIYTVTSRVNDQINLNFGDGVFSEIPVGLFRSYVRSSNGLSYIITPDEMQSVTIAIGYIGRTGRQETLTFTCGLSQAVSNAAPRENIADIKYRAPARYYTQNRMVNGEDYNNFPFTLYSTIIKSKAVNRASIGTSRYLDLSDQTGKYSSINVFGSDGALYEEDALPSFNFTFTDTNAILNFIINNLEPLISTRGMLEFYYNNFPRPPLTQISGFRWNQSTTLSNSTSGYFYIGSATNPAPIGPTATDNKKYITQGALVQFVPPAGQYFDANNRLQTGLPVKPDDKLILWATVTSLYVDGTNQGLGNFADGAGPVVLNNNIPTGAIPTQVIPVFVTDLPASIEQSISEQFSLYRNFGLGYNDQTASWYVISQNNLDNAETFSLAHAQDTTGQNLDNSWLVIFQASGSVGNERNYVVSSRSLDRYFGSVLQTRFFYDGSQQVYDPRTGQTINDYINVLKTNSQPDSALPLNNDEILDIVGQPVEADGYVNDYRVRVSFGDFDNDGVADDPDYFQTIVGPTVNTASKYVFLKQITDYDNLQRWVLCAPGEVSAAYATEDQIALAVSQWPTGQVFYAYGEGTFYVMTVNVYSGARTLSQTTAYQARVGRDSIAYQYRHNAPLSRRIDPGSTNIIDIYLVTSAYYTAYQNYINDSTDTVPEPTKPTIDELSVAYNKLQDYKMISDNIILNSVTFKPLFGNKANSSLRGQIKVIRYPKSTVSFSEIRSAVTAKINEYFTIDKWDFGQTFYFSELAAYLHSELGQYISTVVLVPTDAGKSFGDLYEIRCMPNEIFVNAATVNDILVIDALTSTELKTSPNSGVI